MASSAYEPIKTAANPAGDKFATAERAAATADAKRHIVRLIASIAVLGVTVYLLAFTFASNSPTAAQPQSPNDATSAAQILGPDMASTAAAATTPIAQSINRFAAELLEVSHTATV